MARGIPRGRAPPPLAAGRAPQTPRALERPAPALTACQPGSLAGSAAKAAAATGSQRPLAGPRGSARHCGTAGEAVRSLPHPRPAARGAGQAAPPPPARPPTAGRHGRGAGGVTRSRGTHRTAALRREPAPPPPSSFPPRGPAKPAGHHRTLPPAARTQGGGRHRRGGRKPAAGSPAEGPTPRGGTHRCPGTAPSAEGRAPQPAAAVPTRCRQKDARLGAVRVLFRHFILSTFIIRGGPVGHPRPHGHPEGCTGAQARSHPPKDTLTLQQNRIPEGKKKERRRLVPQRTAVAH